ncbi:MAG TPA: cupin domain-containing protein [Planctomycetota bacterium]|nr:cupin domain-containing protein [Planctomycetota bacterium]
MDKAPAPPAATLKPGLQKSTTFDLVTLVDYRPESIVSRVLGSGAVTLFAFDAGQSLSEHSTPMDALVQVLEGHATIVIAGKPHLLGAGQIILMPANVPHGLQATTRFKMLLTMYRV